LPHVFLQPAISENGGTTVNVSTVPVWTAYTRSRCGFFFAQADAGIGMAAGTMQSKTSSDMPTFATSDSAENWRLAPAMVGMPVAAVDTPALLVDLDALEFNLASVHDRIRAAGIAVRPHVKAHKSVDLARRQIAAGAAGICCQKASEAEVFVRAGFSDVLITNQVIGRPKCTRVAQLATMARIGVCIDHPEQVRQIGDAARAAGSLVEVLVEVDIGHGRCGVADAAETLALVRAVKSYEGNLLFAGIHAFRGSAQHMCAQPCSS
jgi:D-serine deaminase-like pyridoxal phosphate-dependent protein